MGTHQSLKVSYKLLLLIHERFVLCNHPVQVNNFIRNVFNTEPVDFQLYFRGDFLCIEWISTNQSMKLQEIGNKLALFVQMLCGSHFPPPTITSSPFSCHDHNMHIVRYKANASMSTSELSKEKLKDALREWQMTYRSIWIQKERLTVESCPVIIQPPQQDSGCMAPVMVSLTTFLVTVAASVCATMLGTIAVIITTVFLCKRKKRQAEWVVCKLALGSVYWLLWYYRN